MVGLTNDLEAAGVAAEGMREEAQRKERQFSQVFRTCRPVFVVRMLKFVLTAGWSDGG